MPSEKDSTKAKKTESVWSERDICFFKGKVLYGDKPAWVKQALSELGYKEDNPLHSNEVDLDKLEFKLMEIGSRSVNQQMERSDEQRKFTAY